MPSIYQLYMESPLRTTLRHELKQFVEKYCNGLWTLDFGGGVYTFEDLFERYCTINFDLDQKPRIAGDLEGLPIKDDSVEAGICVDVLEHVQRPYLAVKEIHRVLKPGAPIWFHVPFVFNVHAYPSDYFRYSHHGLRQILEDAGFRDIEVNYKPYSGFFYTMSHIYRFIYEPRKPLFWLRFIGFALLWILRPLDRWFRRGNMKLFYIGVHATARK